MLYGCEIWKYPKTPRYRLYKLISEKSPKNVLDKYYQKHLPLHITGRSSLGNQPETLQETWVNEVTQTLKYVLEWGQEYCSYKNQMERLYCDPMLVVGVTETCSYFPACPKRNPLKNIILELMSLLVECHLSPLLVLWAPEWLDWIIFMEKAENSIISSSTSFLLPLLNSSRFLYINFVLSCIKKNP